MKRFWIVLAVLALVAVPLAAQEHAKEKKASSELVISMAVKIGGNQLEPGRYRLACDRTEVSITRLEDGKKITLPCKGKEMERKAEATELYTDLDKDGVRVVEKLLIRGSNVEHTF